MPELNISTYARLQKLAGIVLIGFVMVMFLTEFDMIQSRIRDTKRRADIKALVNALDLYYYNFNRYPDSINDWRSWELSLNYNGGKAEFIKNLIKAGLLDKLVKDPINNSSYYYRYQKFQAGDYGCKNSFYILQIANFELFNDDHGQGYCPGFNWAEAMPNGYTVQSFN